MPTLYEITTITRNSQNYGIIEAYNGKLEILEGKDEMTKNLLKEAYATFQRSGLENSIKRFPQDIGATNFPDTLRIIYEKFSLSTWIPILRVCPTEKEEICISELNVKTTDKLKKITISQEFGGSWHLEFDDLFALVHARNFEKENNTYFERDMRKQYLLKDGWVKK